MLPIADSGRTSTVAVLVGKSLRSTVRSVTLMICRHPAAGLSTSTPVTEGETRIAGRLLGNGAGGVAVGAGLAFFGQEPVPHGEKAGGGPVGRTGFGVDVLDGSRPRLRADEKGAGNVLYGGALGDQAKDLGLSRRQPGRALAAAAQDARVHVIQEPRILTTHATPASIFVGNTVPYVTGTTMGPGGRTSSSYQQLSVGLNSTFGVIFGKPQIIQADENGEVSILVSRQD